MYTAEKTYTCPDWKITCPLGHVTAKVYVPWDKIYLPRARINVNPCPSSKPMITQFTDAYMRH